MGYEVKDFYDEATNTLTYIVFNKLQEALVIDPVLDYDQAASKIHTASNDKVEDFIKEKGLKVLAILETHAHADHLSGAQDLKRRFPQAKLAIGENIRTVQAVFKEVFNLKNLNVDGTQFDILLEEGLHRFGEIEIETIFTPGHTPACSSYKIGNNVFTGDALFMPDYGTGRCDFPGGSASSLYNSVHNKLYSLPDDTNTFTGHDYQPGGREVKFKASIGEHKKENIHIKAETTEEEFVEFRTARDKTLNAPKLLLPSVQVNVDGGKLPEVEDNGVSYLRIPIK
ncbi:MAG: MBL fold metallo-hydrolase [Bdellovibrionota bacterium]|nr:MBL fold metallo-hydrolase [Bdellovibrionota bacterium]